jgi:hypothetical protein
MWLLVELIIIPILIVLWIIVSSLTAHFGIGPVLLGLTLNIILFLVVGSILRFLWRLETDEGIHDDAHSK